MPTVAIISQGDEVLTGQTVDTNAAWLSEQATALGLTVVRHLTLGDDLSALTEGLRQAAALADVVLCTGGLGPTTDDLTAEAVALAFDAPLALDAQALEQIEAMYRRFRRAMPEANRKQAMLPSGSTRIDNPWGTAPGFHLRAAASWLFCMPGVPFEMKKMFRASVVPALAASLSLQPRRQIVLHTTGQGESNLQQLLTGLSHPGVTLSYRAMVGHNQVKLIASPELPDAELAAFADEATARLGTCVFARTAPGDAHFPTLVSTLAERLAEAGHTLATAESCTGGQLAAACTSLSGSSTWFLEGAVTYSNAAKVRQLGVQPATLEAVGAVSEAVARQMAEGMRARSGATFALSTTGIAGPTGGTGAKPVGTVHIALAGPAGTAHQALHLPGDRAAIQRRTVAAALDLLRRHLPG